MNMPHRPYEIAQREVAALREQNAQLVAALREILDDTILDSDTQRLLRGHKVARAALAKVQS